MVAETRFREEPEILREAQCSPLVETLDAELLKDLRGLGKAADVRWKRRRIPRLSLQFSSPHERCRFCFTNADG